MTRSLLVSVATVATAVSAASAAVSQVHLGLSSANVNCANGISVSFASDVAAPFTVTATAVGATSKTAQSSAITYSVDEPEYKYSYTSPSLHTALLCDLASNQKYSYSIGSEYASSFVTPPHAGADDVETIIGVVGDPGDTTYSETTLSELGKPFEGKTVQAIFVAGDYSYANGEQRQWDNWFDEQMNLTSYIPFTGINGNHETITNAGHLSVAPFPADRTLRAENYLGYLSRVYTPITPAARAALKTWYSLDIGLVHSVFLDDYTGSNGTDMSVVGSARWLAYREEQLAWLKADLASVDRTVTPWVIVFKHNPYYNTWGNHQCQCSSTIFEIADADAENCWKGVYKSGTPHYEPHCGLQAKLEDVYVQYKVNLVMAGHVHAYERTHKIYKNKVDTAKGVYYVTTGGAGNYEGHAGPRLNSSLTPSWSLAANNVTFGGSRVIATRKSLRTVWFANEFLNKDEAVASDGFTINADGDDVITWPATPTTPAPTTATPVPVTKTPVTPAPDTPVTQAPVTQAPVTQTPATKTPTTQTPATQGPTTPASSAPAPTRASC